MFGLYREETLGEGKPDLGCRVQGRGQSMSGIPCNREGLRDAEITWRSGPLCYVK